MKKKQWNITRFDTCKVEDDINYDSDEEQKSSEIPSIEFAPVDVKEIRTSSTKIKLNHLVLRFD